MKPLQPVVRSSAFAVVMFAIGLSCSTAMAAPPAAFVQPDPGASTPPFDRVKVMRGTAVVPSDTALMPCDKISLAKTDDSKGVRLTTVRGGRNVLLTPSSPEYTVACEAVSQSEAWVRVWKAISGGERSTTTVPAATRGGMPLSIPVLTAPKSSLIAGPRTLHLAWEGGTPPFKVVLTRKGDPKPAFEMIVRDKRQIQMPGLELPPGQYSLAVFDTGPNGQTSGLRDDDIHVVEPSKLPRLPSAPGLEKLSELDSELLRVFYLEGLPGDEWLLEAFQRAAAIKDKSPAAAAWIGGYGMP